MRISPEPFDYAQDRLQIDGFVEPYRPTRESRIDKWDIEDE
jgi:hypothetical protein